MASTSVHLPPALVMRLDRLAAERGTSRNRVIVAACEQMLDAARGEWPEGYFSPPARREDLKELRAGGREMEEAIVAARRQRAVPQL